MDNQKRVLYLSMIKKTRKEVIHNNIGNITQKYLEYYMISGLWDVNLSISPQITFQVGKEKKPHSPHAIIIQLVNYEIKCVNRYIFASNDQFHIVKAHKSLKMLTK